MILTALTAKLFNAIASKPLKSPVPKKDITADAWAWIAEHYPESKETKQKFRRENQDYIGGGHSAFHKREQARIKRIEWMP